MLNEESTNIGLVSCEKTLFQKIFMRAQKNIKTVNMNPFLFQQMN